jgi:hypothetical protein
MCLIQEFHCIYVNFKELEMDNEFKFVLKVYS